ncbi:MAG: type II toxin-antitoxin system RelE/ParE family toxin [Clostridiales bacterium]|nr:type II toxin-antitoxin system RelE/ParE family toxin [Clostridiales bacterium]
MRSEGYSFEITEKAERDLDDILRYISVELANPKAASRFIEDFMKAVDEVCSFPECGALVDNEYIPVRSVRHMVIGNYVMYYLPDQNKKICFVLRLIYGRRDLRGLLGKSGN